MTQPSTTQEHNPALPPSMSHHRISVEDDGDHFSSEWEKIAEQKRLIAVAQFESNIFY